MKDSTLKKLEILAESAKYDVSCASSGTSRKNMKNGIGSAHGWGICHSFTGDGRCVALLKIMLTNFCLYDCAYCINRQSNDIPRAAFSPKELVELTIEFYRRNYIEGLFLSSGIIKNPDHTMERMLRVIKDLRTIHRFNGYIHMKTIPGASSELVYQAGLYADRLSVNLEIPTEANLKRLAPDKDHQSIYLPMGHIQQHLLQNKEERKKFRHAPKFAAAGQSTQIIVGATDESDKQILQLTSKLYKRPSMKRVYYSGFVPVNSYDKRLPVVHDVPRQRENRLYQADWLLRFYHFDVNEIVNDQYQQLDLNMDPKLAWAIRNPQYFPVDINRASYETILRVPGIGIKSAKLIVSSRRHGRLNLEALRRIGVVLKRAHFFIVCAGMKSFKMQEASADYIRISLQEPAKSIESFQPQQLSMLL
ncbi:putative DNA modification/repair radical SAM protein [Frischella perrara]|uniref:Putative DNA modification/repair radical SAM protein n=1 Tax=Frischella perrara TaxID=1267021 RepID=A0A318MTF5_FRIPE|nr:putative DNA modification/repair radical SAM protein [Frischella perrara]PXY96599.1 putative DNA modification/repair radical SAM protein [Frischella perrara]